jgi:hypothetical protein
MKKNVVTIIFLFSLIFVTLMFEQEAEGFVDLPYAQTKNDTYFTKETKVGQENVSVFSALGDFSNEIRDKVNNYEAEITTITNGVATTTKQTGGIKPILEICLNNSTDKTEKEMCYRTHYETQMQSIGNKIFDINGSGNKLADAVNRNTDKRVTKDQYETTKSHVQNTYNSNRQIQLDLDRKMNEMLNDKSGMKLESATKQSSAMYLSILGTVLATTALYYIFIRI